MFKTELAAGVSGCRKFLGFLHISYQIDTRTARFIEKFIISDIGICMLFERYAKIGTNKIKCMVTSIQFQT